jgi:hypothetical protein
MGCIVTSPFDVPHPSNTPHERSSLSPKWRKTPVGAQVYIDVTIDICSFRFRRVHMNKMMTVAQLAKRLGVKPNTLRGWARTGVVPCIRLSTGCIRFDVQEIEQVLDARRSGGSTRKRRPR